MTAPDARGLGHPPADGSHARGAAGVLLVAVRRLVLFTAPAPTGWRQIGRTAFRGFRAETDASFALLPECRTTGGYPRIATVLPDDLPIVA